MRDVVGFEMELMQIGWCRTMCEQVDRREVGVLLCSSMCKGSIKDRNVKFHNRLG